MSPLKLPWPEIRSSRRPDDTIRQILDYLVWVTGTMRNSPAYGGPGQDAWRQRASDAYEVLFLPPVPGHGDPYPPDIPPAETPGTWPDIPAIRVPGMTVRHQLKVIQLLALELRDRVWAHGRSPEFADWDRRLCEAREILDHGETHPMPEEASTQPSADAMAEAEAQEEARRLLARKRERRLRRLKKPAKKKAAKKKAVKKKAATKKKVAKKKVTKKKAAKKNVAKKKTTKKKASAKKRTTRKKAARKTTRRK